MAKKPLALRVEEELLARVKVRALELGQSQTVFVTRALEAALGSVVVPAAPEVVRSEDVIAAFQKAAVSPPPSSRAPVERTSGGALVMAREALDETPFADAVARMEPQAPKFPHGHVCPERGCDFSAPSPNAVCPDHQRKIRAPSS